MPFKDPLRKKEYNKKYGKIYRSIPKVKQQKADYQKRWASIPENKERRKGYELRPERKLQRKEYRSLITSKIRTKNWLDIHPNYQKEYVQLNPEVNLKAQIKYLTKLAKPLNQSMFEYKTALRLWGKVIKKRDGSCVICGSTDKLQAHHTIHRNKYPQLSFVENNGILLCKQHHNEVHGKCLKVYTCID